MTQAARDGFRAQFLLACYQKHGTAQAWEKDGGLIAVGLKLAAELGVEEGEAWEAYRWLSRKGFIIATTQAGGGRVAPSGQDLAEEWIRKIEATPSAARKIGFDTSDL